MAHNWRLIALVAGLGMAGSGVPAGSYAAPRSSAPVADPHAQIIRTILTGLAAEAHGDRKRMMQSADMLTRLGAEPQTDQPDLAARWRAGGLTIGPANAAAGGHGTTAAADPGIAYRGRALGASYRLATLGPAQTFSSEQTFLAGQTASVTARLQRDARLTLQVTSGDGAQLCHSGFVTRTAQCKWVPIATDRSKVMIVNYERRSIDLVLLTN